MTIQRQYSLPNCKLILEGLSGDSPLDPTSTRPLVSVVTNVECHISGYEKPLSGGRDFLEGLLRAVSEYAQEYLSGVPHAAAHGDRHHPSLVRLERVDKNIHRLMVEPQIADQSSGTGSPAQLDLTTVQLFDLVEAVDQFFADAQTLPELALTVSPIHKRHVAAKEPVTKQAVPVALGLSSLAVAAVALFFLPIPEVRRPQPTPESATQTSPVASPSAGNSPNDSPTPESSASPAGSPTASSPTAAAAAPTAAASPAEAIFAGNVPEILDPAELEQLTGKVYDQLDRGWTEKAKTTPITFNENLEYRVGVARTGDIRGYKYVNGAALTYLEETPLADLQFPSPSPATSPASESPGSPSAQEPLAQFLVVFKPNGVLEVSPWYGEPLESSPSPAASPSPSP